MKILCPFYSAARRSALSIILLVAGVSMSAQQRNLQVIPGHSTARVFLGTAGNPTSFEVGVAKVKGEVQLSSDDISASRFSLTIYSDELKDLKVYGGRSVIAFQSQSVEQSKDGKLEVRGRLTVTQVFGEEAAKEDYSDTSSNNLKRLRTSQEVTFVFDGLEQPASASDLNSGSAVPAQTMGSEQGMLVTASMSVDGEASPLLLLTIHDVAWPVIADDQSCAPNSASGDHFRGATCPSVMSAASPGQSRDEEAPPAGNLVTIQLKLTLASADSDSGEGLQHTKTVR